MKRWSFRIATIAGTEVRIHLTFLLLLVFWGWGGLAAGGWSGAWHAGVFLCSMFLCVLLHEFGHVLAARAYGIRTPDITLLPIGGLARLERMPRQPWHEFVVAICGPLVNVAIAAVLGLAIRVFPGVKFDFDPVQGDFLVTLMQWNIIMVVFNMIPAFPMDGGRVLRAALAAVMDYGAATRVAAAVGQGIAVFGIIVMLFVWNNPILLIIALFIYLSAGQEAAVVGEEEATRGLRVGDAMVTDFQSLREDARLDEAVEILLQGSQQDFPVLEDGGRLRGMLTRTGLIGALAAHGRSHPVREVLEPPGVVLDPDQDLAEAMQVLRASLLPVLPVVGASGRLAGLLTTENIGEMLMVRSALARKAGHSR